ncbi:MAG: DoxX family membrane protein, partial [Bacteroidota bacterium]
MKKGIQILFIVFRLVLGGMMVYGGIQKFQKPIPKPVEVVETASKFTSPEKESTLQKILYISGAKQTGYFWQVLGVCELLFGLLLILQGTSFIGAVLLLPITLHI